MQISGGFTSFWISDPHGRRVLQNQSPWLVGQLVGQLVSYPLDLRLLSEQVPQNHCRQLVNSQLVNSQSPRDLNNGSNNFYDFGPATPVGAGPIESLQQLVSQQLVSSQRQLSSSWSCQSDSGQVSQSSFFSKTALRISQIFCMKLHIDKRKKLTEPDFP